MDNGTPTLFDLRLWRPPLPAPTTDEAVRERQQLLEALANSELGTLEQRVTYLLHHFPETRDSDTALAIRYWETFQADKLEAWDRCNLHILFDLDRIETIGRLRRHIQNDLGLFASTTRTGHLRHEMQLEFHRYLAEQRRNDPEIRFYLDETGADTSRLYTGVAGICVLDWRQYEMHHAALIQWRRNQGWPETLHFTDIGADNTRHLALLNQFAQRRAGLLFLGHAIPSRGMVNYALVDLFIQLVVDSLKRARDLNCLTRGRAVTVYKEASPGFDKFHLATVHQYLTEQIAREFPDALYVRDVYPIRKGLEPMLECADLIAGAMQRRACYGGHHPKDVLAEAVMNITGFEDAKDPGAVFNAYLA